MKTLPRCWHGLVNFSNNTMVKVTGEPVVANGIAIFNWNDKLGIVVSESPNPTLNGFLPRTLVRQFVFEN